MTALLARDHVTDFVWRRGVLDTVTFHHHGGEEALDETLRKLARDPVARLVRRLVISAVQYDGAGDLEPAIAELAELAPRFPRLVELAVQEGLDLGNPWIEGPIRVGNLEPLYAAYPRLRVFELAGKEYQLGTMQLPQLHKLAIEDMTPSDLGRVAAAALPSLAQLELLFGRWRVDDIDAVFRPLFDRAMPTLQHLALATEVTPVMQYFIRVVPASALARHLRSLAFRGGPMHPDCSSTLVAWAPRLRALERLEIEGHGVSPEGRATLERAFGRILVLR
jgi:hypothetical protein